MQTCFMRSICLFLIITFFTNCSLSVRAQIPVTAYPNDRSIADTSIAPFYHGVASGDPTSSKIIIWTRVTSQMNTDTVSWFFATDSLMQHLIKQGTFITNPDLDHTVKVDVTDLSPNTYYYYIFKAYGKYSQVGRTKTMPDGNVNNIRIGVVNCSNYSFGYFNAYDILNQRNDFDFVFHQGDYIYEDGFHLEGVDTIHRRVYPEYDAFDKATYEMRYSWYRLDPSLRELHRQYPWIIIWDDHEFANDATKDTSIRHYPATQGTWANRKKAAIAAFKEWIPFREDTSNSNIINHTQHLGNLADIIYIENRIQRDDLENALQILNLMFGVNNPLTYANPSQTMLGKRQVDWICSELKQSTAKWKILGNQLVFTPYVFRGPLGLKTRHPSAWDIYPWDRKKILDTIAINHIKNFVVLGGDIHIAMAFDIIHDSIPYNASDGAGALGVEFDADNTVEGGNFGGGESWMYANNPQLKYVNTKSQGFIMVDINQDKICCDYWQADSINTLNTKHTYLKTFCSNSYANHLTNEAGPTIAVNNYPPLLSYHVNADTILGIKQQYGNVELLKLYPNPTRSYLRIQYFMHITDQLIIDLYDNTGKKINEINLGIRQRGLNEESLEIPPLPAGDYIMDFITGSTHSSRKISIF